MKGNVKAFIVLQFLSAFFFLVLVLTATLSSRIRRYSTWYSFCISWIISSLSYTLLVIVNAYVDLNDFSSASGSLAGGRGWEAERVCLTQAAMIYASPVLTAFTSLAMCLHILLSVREAFQVPATYVKATTTTMFIVIPYIIWVVMFVVLFLLGQADPKAVQLNRTGYYCHLELPEPVVIGAVISILATVGVAVAETWVAIQVHKHRDRLSKTTHPMAFIVRVLLFGLVDIFALIVELLFILPGHARYQASFLLSLIPLLGLLIFGSQNDILQVWMFWRRSEASVPDPSSLDTTSFPPSLSTRWHSSSQNYLDPYHSEQSLSQSAS